MQIFFTTSALFGVSLVVYSSFQYNQTEQFSTQELNSSLLLSKNVSGTTSLNYYNNLNFKGCIIALLCIFGTALSDSIEVIVIAVSSLKEMNATVLGFWYFFLGTLFSMMFSAILEPIIIPHSITDKLLVVVHSITGSGVTCLAIVSIQILEPSVFSILQSSEIPMALICQMFLLQTLTPPVDLLFFILGLFFITMSVIVISVHTLWVKKSGTSRA